MTFRTVRLFCAAGLLLLVAQAAQAASVTLAWDPTSEATVTGYRVQYGDRSGVYQREVDAGPATTLTIDHLLDTATYYFVVQAYTADGTLSPLSAEVRTGAGPTDPLGPADFITRPAADGRLTTATLAWGAVADAQAYYLYVGTAAGLKNLVDTRETPATSVVLPVLPATQPAYARLWTKQAGRWRSVDMTFLPMAVPASLAQLLSPAAGATRVSAATGFTWSAVPGAQAYYLYVGTTRGAKNVVDTRETPRTTWAVPALPAGAHLFATLWTKRAGVWAATESTFDTTATATLSYPVAGTDDVSARETFTWGGVTGAEAYRLVIGSTPGASDLLDSGETTATAHLVTGLAPGQTRFATLGTKRAGVWTVDAVPFTTSLSARFTRPLSGDGRDLGQGLGWTPILGAEAYGLALGTTLGGADLFATDALDDTTFAVPALPAGQPLFLRVGTRLGGVWRERTTTVTLLGAALISPRADATTGKVILTAGGTAFTWTPISNAEAFYLGIGTTPGAKDLFDSGEVQTTTVTVPDLPRGRVLHVSVWTKANGTWNVIASTLIAQ